MKTTIKFLAVSLIFSLLLLSTYSCNEPKQKPGTPTPNPAETDKQDNSATTTPPSKADLMILNANLVKSPNPDKWYTHLLIVTIRNNGDSVAKGFHSSCTYDCQGGTTTSGGSDVVQGGYIAANSEFVYKVPFHIYCEGPPAFLHLKFDVDTENSVIESNENNNKKTIQVAVAF